MDEYPYAYTTHSRPLVLLCGLNNRLLERDGNSLLSNGPRIASEFPCLNNARSQALEAAFLKFDPGDGIDQSSDSGIPLSSTIFRFKSCGREYTLPCRKASPAAAELGSAVGNSGFSTLRSPFSPLSHGSPLYPDGIMTPSWPMKYHDAIPAVLISAYTITFDPQNDVVNDNRLKSEINHLKASLAESNYGTTLAVVLLADESMEKCLSTEERLTNIRKGTKLENKSTFFYLPHDVESTELRPFALSCLSGIRPLCMEFYKAHYKKSRRKKDRSGDSAPSSPSTEGVPRNLPKAGWAVRAEYKMAIFSEFRFEMDAAARHHKEVIDLMMEVGGLFEQNPFWSPRWKELRLLADTCALRRIRCLLANGQTSSAARFWRVYHDRTQQLLERRGKGTSNYGWKAWEARFAKCMAEILKSMFYLVTDTSARKVLESISNKQTSAYVAPEKALQSEVLAPSDYLHHPGFWYKLSSKYSGARRLMAGQIPEEDLVPPGQSPATKVARRSEVFDTFLCPDPHLEGTSHDHVEEIVDLLEKALAEYSERGQAWTSERLRLSVSANAKDSSHLKESLLRGAWKLSRWRNPMWTAIMRDIAITLHSMAVNTDDLATQIQTTWELLNSHLGKSSTVNYDINALLDRGSETNETVNSVSKNIEIEHKDTLSFLNVTFRFATDAENLGEPVCAQISLHSNAHNDSATLNVSSILVTFHGNAPELRIVHSNSPSGNDPTSLISKVKLHESTKEGAEVVGEADLALAPQQTKVFAVELHMREPGKVSAAKAVVGIERSPIKIQYIKNLDSGREQVRWYLLRNGRLSSQRLFPRSSHLEIDILPKLPKVKIHLPTIEEKYYVGERVWLDLELVNEETYEVQGSLNVRLVGNFHNDDAYVKITEASDQEVEKAADGQWTTADACNFGALAPDGLEKKRILVQMPDASLEDLKLEFEARYNQAGETLDSVCKTTSAKVSVVEPLRTNFSISPDWHPNPWPSFFDLNEEADGDSEEANTNISMEPRGLSSRWNLHTNIVSLADVDLSIEKIELSLHTLSQGAIASVRPLEQEKLMLGAAEQSEVSMLIDVVKQEMEDMNPTVMNPALKLYWRRTSSESSDVFEKFIPAPKMNLPSSEPHVIATTGKTTEEAVEVMLHLSNPSLHYLSFEVSIEPSDDFAFSGPKLGEVHLVPYSRHTMSFTLLPFVRGMWIQPLFKVVDIYFNKTLRVNAGSGIKRDSAGALLVWVGS